MRKVRLVPGSARVCGQGRFTALKRPMQRMMYQSLIQQCQAELVRGSMQSFKEHGVAGMMGEWVYLILLPIAQV